MNGDRTDTLALALVGLNDETPVRSQTHFHAMLSLANDGGLPDSPEMDALDAEFTFEARRHGPFWTGFEEWVDDARDRDLVADDELRITDAGLERLDAAVGTPTLDVADVRTLKLVKYLHNDSAALALADKARAAAGMSGRRGGRRRGLSSAGDGDSGLLAGYAVGLL